MKCRYRRFRDVTINLEGSDRAKHDNSNEVNRCPQCKTLKTAKTPHFQRIVPQKRWKALMIPARRAHKAQGNAFEGHHSRSREALQCACNSVVEYAMLRCRVAAGSSPARRSNASEGERSSHRAFNANKAGSIPVACLMRTKTTGESPDCPSGNSEFNSRRSRRAIPGRVSATLEIRAAPDWCQDSPRPCNASHRLATRSLRCRG